MLLRALRPFTSHPDVGQVIVVVPAGFEARPPEWLGKLVGDRLALVAGGATRAQSVRAGLGALPPQATGVRAPAAARPSGGRPPSVAWGGLASGAASSAFRPPRCGPSGGGRGARTSWPRLA